MTKTTKKQRKEQETRSRVERLNQLRAFVNQSLDQGSCFVKQKKQLAMDAYHFYLNLEKRGAVDDEEPDLTTLPQLHRPEPVKPLEVDETVTD